MKNFKLGIIFRIVLIAACLFAAMFFYFKANYSLLAVAALLGIWAAYALYLYTTQINKKLSRLFESIKYQDFNILFKKDNDWGHSFRDLNEQLNAVVASFNKERQEREASFHFIQAIVKQLSVGVLVLNHEGRVELSNMVVGKLLGLYRIGYFEDIVKANAQLAGHMQQLKNGESLVLKVQDKELSIHMAELLLRGRSLKLFSFQDIQSELQSRELEAWQNLTKVLRHEIMNSLTPIISLTQTAEDIVRHDLKQTDNEAYDDLLASMQTIKNRSKGILNFVNAYREFTKLPEPQMQPFRASELQEPLDLLFANSHKQATFSFNLVQDFEIMADKDQLTQVLINLVKNALEADYESVKPVIEIVFKKDAKHTQIEVHDNGMGIKADMAEQIFVPFFSTKAKGSGVGLSLSRQIIQNHGGKLQYFKNPASGSIFRIEL